MIKALFFDLDGTLLNSERKITLKTQIALENCVRKGYKLFVATARPPLLDRMLSWDRTILSLFAGGLYYNGGCIMMGTHKDYTFIPDNIVRKIVSSASEYDNLNIILQLKDEKHAFRYKLEDKKNKGWGVNTDEVLTLSQAYQVETVKILLFSSNNINSKSLIDDNIVSVLRDICSDNAQFYLTDKGKYIHIMNKNANKLRSIEEIRKWFGYAKDEIAVFGDDVNDIEMLSEYPFSIAMGNAESQIKAIAKIETLDNDNDGVYEAICNILHLI